ncbi:MAG: hypothetical protein ACPGWS_09845 [Solirubrobacterales bacterium]
MNTPVPATGDLELTVDFDLMSMNNGEKRIVSKETGLSLQALVGEMQSAGERAKKTATAENPDAGKEDALLGIDAFDMNDLNYAYGRIALRRMYGVEADTPANADRVVLITVESDPT